MQARVWVWQYIWKALEMGKGDGITVAMCREPLQAPAAKTRILVWTLSFGLALALSFLFYYRAIDGFFILDDYVWLDCARVASKDLANVFTLEISNFFRPVAHLVFAGLYAVFDTSPAPYHVVNLVAHALCVALLAQLTLLLTRARGTALLCAALFALTPSYGEVMVWISAVTEPLNTIFVLLALIGWTRYLQQDHASIAHYLLTLISFVLALCAKESAVSLLPLMVILHLGLWVSGQARRIRPRVYLPLVVLLGIYLVFQFQIQQQSYLVKHELYSIGFHGVSVSVRSALEVFADAWPPLVAAALGAVALRIPRARLRAHLGLGGTLLAGLATAIVPYAMFGGASLPGRYYYLSSMVLALAGALALVAITARSRRAGRALIAVALAGMLINNGFAAHQEVTRHLAVANETKVFVKAALELPPLDTPIIIVDGRLLGQHLTGAMRIFPHSHHRSRFYSVRRNKLPRYWRHGSVWRWDPPTRRLHRIPPPTRK